MEIREVPLNQVWHMRREVMYPGAAIEEVKLKEDEAGRHVGLYLADDLVSIISVFVNHGEMQFRKFATMTDLQGRGYGTQLLQYVMGMAGDLCCNKVWCNARTKATGFYAKFGMRPVGSPWRRGGLEYIKMEK